MNLPERQRENGVGSDFKKLNECLLASYQPGEIVPILLKKSLQTPDAQVKVSELAEVAREAFLKVHSLEDEDRYDPLTSHEAFCRIVLHNLYATQRKLIKLYTAGENPEGYMLVVEGEEVVRWEKYLVRIKELLSQQGEA